MSNKLYVGNLSFRASTQDLEDAFAPYGEVTDVYIATDRETGRSRGFAFVTLETEEQAAAAQEAMDNGSIAGREVRVSIARPREERPARRPRYDD